MTTDMTPLTYDPLRGQTEHPWSAMEVSARQTQEALLNVFFVASNNAPAGVVQPFDAFALGALTAYLSERAEDYDRWYKEKLG